MPGFDLALSTVLIICLQHDTLSVTQWIIVGLENTTKHMRLITQ